MRFGDLPFVVAILLVAALAAIGVATTVELGESAYWAVGILPAAVVASIYLLGYQKRLPPGPKTTPEDDDDFDDPVAEAAMLESSGGLPAEPAMPSSPAETS